MEFNNIYQKDCISGMNELGLETINLIVTSPPYNLYQTSVKKKIEYNTYDDSIDFKNYLMFMNSVLFNAYDVLTKDGRMVINIGDKQNGSIPTHYYLTKMALEIGFKPYTTIIWNKSQVNSRTAWGSWMSPSCPSFPTPFEYILVFYKESKKLLRKGETDLTREEFINWSLSLWSFPPETRMKKMGHPAMFPEELPRRCIKLFSYKGDVVLDPFAGLGTTCKVAHDLGRRYIGFDLDPLYVEKANSRIKNPLN